MIFRSSMSFDIVLKDLIPRKFKRGMWSLFGYCVNAMGRRSY